MSNTKLVAIVLSALAFAALLAWFVAVRYKGPPGAVPAAAVDAPARPESEAVRPEQRAGKKGAGPAVKRAVLRKRRVSRLQEPGEALGGGKAAILEIDTKAVFH